MSATIEFRGKRIDNGKWAYGGYHKHEEREVSPIGDFLKESDISHLIIQSGFADWNMPKPLQAIRVDPDTVCRFTGFFDEKGTKIFEHDIVEMWSQGVKATGEIIQREDGLWIMYPAYQSGVFWRLWPTGVGTKVIGNIFGI